MLLEEGVCYDQRVLLQNSISLCPASFCTPRPNSDLKKVGKTTRPLRYDLNQIPYNFTVEVTNRFKGLDLIDRVPEKLWMEVHDIVQEAVIKTIFKKKKCKRKKWSSERLYK